jgi:integral membrane protein (TIGR00529 family)
MADLLKPGLVLALILLLIARRWNLGVVLALASLVLTLLSRRSLIDLGRDALIALSDPLTLRLIGIVVLILALGEILRRTARLDGMIHSLEHLLPDTRIVFALIPALIGLLPMIGGAMFSAPMVNRIGRELGADAERRTFVNYWFRHIWEYVFPLYPSFLLGAALLGLSVRQASAILWPLAIVSLLGGVLFGLLGLRRQKNSEPAQTQASLRELALSIWPIAVVLLLSVVIGIDLIISLLLTILLLALLHRIGPRQCWDIARHHIRWETVIVIAGAMVFRQVLEATGSIAAAAQALIGARVPIAVAVFAVPFFAGLLSGLGTAAFAIGFPIVLPLIGNSPLDLGWAAWAWTGGFMGVMMSPLHLCLALTRVYFEADWGLLYRRIVPAVLLSTAAAGLLAVVL